MKNNGSVRGKWKYTDKGLVPIGDTKKKEVDAPSVLPDEIPPTRSNASPDSPYFTSRRKKKEYELARGFREALPGEFEKDCNRPRTREDELKEEAYDKETVEAAYYDVKYGRVKFTDKEKERHLRENRKWPENKIKPPV